MQGARTGVSIATLAIGLVSAGVGLGSATVGGPVGPIALAIGSVIAALGLLAFVREARRLRHSEARHAEDAAALRRAYGDLEQAKRKAEVLAVETRAMLAGMSDGVMVLDPDLRLAHWNDRFAEITGVPATLLRTGTDMADLVRGQAEAGEFGPLDGPAAVAEEVGRRMDVLRQAVRFPTEERFRPDGRALELRRTRLPDGSIVSLYTDITIRKRAEAAERASVAAATAAAEQKRYLAAMVSHEIRVPLDALLSSLALIDTGALVGPQRAVALTARQAGQALRELVSDILDLTGLDDGRLVLRPTDFSPAASLDQIAALFGGVAAARRLTISVAVDPALPPMIRADAQRLRQVVMNFVSNAAKFASPGELIVRADLAGPGELRVSVTDPGPVIPAAQAGQLFQPFTRLAAAEMEGKPGSGLGLAISARLVGMMGGRIGLETDGPGNQFWLAVPFGAPATDADGQHAAGLLRPLRRARILLVEDAAANRILTATMLRRDGHAVDAVASGEMAVSMAGCCPYDIVLMDNHMPGIGGLEAARRIRALSGPARAVPIVGLTGSDDSPAGRQSLAQVMDAVLIKPASAETIEATLRRFVGPQGRKETAVEPADGADLLDFTLIATMRRGLSQAIFAGLVEQCLEEMAVRLGDLADAPSAGHRYEVAHLLAGMAGTYGLAGFERRMRAIMAGGDVAGLVEGAGDEFEASRAAIRLAITAAA